MSNLSAQAQHLISKFGQEPGVTPDQVANLQAVLHSSPSLTLQVNAAAAAGHLEGFELLPVGVHAGGQYHPETRTIHLPPKMLSAPPGLAFDMAEPAFVLGHELQHGFNRLATKAANETMIKDLEAEASVPSAVHDYTSAIDRRLAQNRRDEASAEISGWNALVDQLRGNATSLTLRDIYSVNSARMSDFIDKSTSRPASYSLKPNLALNPDMSMSPTPANIEAMGVNYFDKPAKGIRRSSPSRPSRPLGLRQLLRSLGDQRGRADRHARCQAI